MGLRGDAGCVRGPPIPARAPTATVDTVGDGGPAPDAPDLDATLDWVGDEAGPADASARTDAAALAVDCPSEVSPPACLYPKRPPEPVVVSHCRTAPVGENVDVVSQVGLKIVGHSQFVHVASFQESFTFCENQVCRRRQTTARHHFHPCMPAVETVSRPRRQLVAAGRWPTRARFPTGGRSLWRG